MAPGCSDTLEGVLMGARCVPLTPQFGGLCAVQSPRPPHRTSLRQESRVALGAKGYFVFIWWAEQRGD